MPTGTVGDSGGDGSEPEHERIRPNPAPEAPGWWRRLRLVGWALFATQLIVLLVWSTVQYRRFALTRDFSIADQAWTLIAHGTFDPFDTVVGLPFWRLHGEFMMWFLGLMGSLWPHGILLLWVQDVAVVCAGVVAFGWIRDMASGAHRSRAFAVVAAALVVLVADPWVYWSVAFDFHFELVGLPFLVLMARTIYRNPGDRRVWVWAVLALACGDVVTTFVLGVGVGAILAGRRWRRSGALVAVVALIWSGMLAVLGADKGSELAVSYGYLAVAAGVAVPPQLGLTQIVSGIAQHPMHVLQVLWSRRSDIYGALGPSGLVGVFSAWGLPIAVLVLFENGLAHYVGFVVPGFQDSAVFIFGAVGTASVLLWLARRRSVWTYVCAAVVALNALGWGALWLPHFADQWLRVSPSAARVLTAAESQISVSDEVIVSQGVSGRFAGREWVYDLQGPEPVPLHTATVWVVLAPNQGIETMAVQEADALAQETAALPGSELIDHGDGVWVFRWSPPAGTKTLVVPAHVDTVSAWAAAGSAGYVSLDGPDEDWTAASTGSPGYVVAGDYWREPAGTYRATVSLSSTGPVNVEVWDTSNDNLLARRRIPATHGLLSVAQTVRFLRGAPTLAYAGAGPFRIDPVPPPPGAVLEIRVWTAGRTQVSVSTLQLRRISPPAASANR